MVEARWIMTMVFCQLSQSFENRKGVVAEELPRRKAFLGKRIKNCLSVASAECYLNLGRSGFSLSGGITNLDSRCMHRLFFIAEITLII